MTSRGWAITNGGSNVSDPLLPTCTTCTAPASETGVGSGEPGYEEYTVVHCEASTVTVTVTRLSSGAAGIVTPPYAAVVSASEAVLAAAGGVDAAEAADADACNCAPIARAEFLKLVNELGAPSAPQLIAKTIPAPQ